MSEGVELSGVCADFGHFRAVDSVSLSVKPGEFFSFLGPSGCGKTTILRMISGFTAPSAGHIRIGGQDMKGVGPNRRPTALIFQNLALFPLMPVWENIAFGLEVRGVSKKERRKKAQALLELVDMPDAADKAIAQLSGGQKQRIAIARALAVEPQVMLLDEPLSALDLKMRQHMRSELRSIQKRTNVTFIYITHDQGEALAMSDRVAVMSQGRLQQVGTPRDIYNDPANGFVASFVGENNIFVGDLTDVTAGFGTFKTAAGPLKAKVGPGVSGSASAKLYLRPENARLQLHANGTNCFPVTVNEVAFEGNFVNVHCIDGERKPHIVQLSNVTGQTVPSHGTRLFLAFNPENAVILADRTDADARSETFQTVGEAIRETAHA